MVYRFGFVVSIKKEVKIMTNLQQLPMEFSTLGNQVILLEAEPGQSRQRILNQWIEAAKHSDVKTCLLNCSHDKWGVWAGVVQLFSDLIPHIQVKISDLLIKHDYELIHVLPALRENISVRNPCLTDIAVPAEKVRNYPADRAYRIIHGLIDLFFEFHAVNHDTSLVIVCDEFDSAGFFSHRFFTELMRRCTQQFNIVLLIVEAPRSANSRENLFGSLTVQRIKFDLPSNPHKLNSPEMMTKLALELEQFIGKDKLKTEIHLPELIYNWSLSSQPERALIYKLLACSTYSHQGFYEEALVYGEAVLEQIEYLQAERQKDSWDLYFKLYFCYAALDKPFKALQMIEAVIEKFQNPEILSQAYYFMAMLHARLLPHLDLEQADIYLQKSTHYVLQSNMNEHRKYFLMAFNQNGLALIRHRQGKAEEAIKLCELCLEQLNVHLNPTEHRLHRSVLFFNIAQVYMHYDENGAPEKAIAYLTEAMEMDPNYSEYYNDRGNLYLKLNRLEEALQDYQKAIELSPPYWEVWSNIGQCHLRMNQLDEAIKAYSRALDLNPNQFAVWVARAEIFERLGMFHKALPDYNAALKLKSDDPLLWANRASLHYEMENYDASLQDLDRAITLDPGNADLYQNRAIALTCLGCINEAVQDLKTYLNLNPSASDHLDIEQRILALQESTSH
jgi:tetratricopeptide (TPR) repeat protein